MKTIKIGFSPCPNDTFIFDALVHQRIFSPVHFLPELRDVEQLNRMAMQSTLEVTKMSFASYAWVSDQYQILNSGSALGRNCGPLLISKNNVQPDQTTGLRVAIPGRNTTANLLLSIFFPELKNKMEMLFSEVEEAVLSGQADLGLIIHENRFTYEQKGLLKVADLGECWEARFQHPIPLGCIAVLRRLPEDQKLEIDGKIRESVRWAFEHPEDSLNYIQQHAREMSREVQQSHIGLYVNQFSIDLGKEGREAVRLLFEKGHESGLLPLVHEPIFING